MIFFNISLDGLSQSLWQKYPIQNKHDKQTRVITARRESLLSHVTHVQLSLNYLHKTQSLLGFHSIKELPSLVRWNVTVG